jgi:ATP-dependent DNA helicase DinG
LSSYLEACARALSDQGRVGKNIAGFKERSGQKLLARAIAENIETQTSLVAEAGTGVGKTFAYLVPALLQEHKVLISTGTKNLQDQLFHKDLPAVLKALGTGQSIANLKGRSNYVCRYHLRHNLAQGEFETKTEITQLKRIERFAEISAGLVQGGFDPRKLPESGLPGLWQLLCFSSATKSPASRCCGGQSSSFLRRSGAT